MFKVSGKSYIICHDQWLEENNLVPGIIIKLNIKVNIKMTAKTIRQNLYYIKNNKLKQIAKQILFFFSTAV